MAALLLFLEKYWMQVVIVVIVAGGIWYVNHLRTTVIAQEQEINTLTIQRKALQDSNDQLAAAINVTNKAVDELHKLAPDTKQQFDTLTTKVTQQTDAITLKLKKILAEKKPLTCDDTIKYLINAQKEYTK